MRNNGRLFFTRSFSCEGRFTLGIQGACINLRLREHAHSMCTSPSGNLAVDCRQTFGKRQGQGRERKINETFFIAWRGDWLGKRSLADTLLPRVGIFVWATLRSALILLGTCSIGCARGLVDHMRVCYVVFILCVLYWFRSVWSALLYFLLLLCPVVVHYKFFFSKRHQLAPFFAS